MFNYRKVDKEMIDSMEIKQEKRLGDNARVRFLNTVIDVLDTGNQKDLKLNNKGEHKI